MECAVCEQKQRQFYCQDCLKQHLLSFRLQSPHLAQERDAAITAANKSLSTVIEPARLRRAQLRECEERVREVWEGLEAVRKDNDRLNSRIRTLRETLSTRRRNLAIASTTLIPQSTQSSSILMPRSHPSSVSPPSMSTSPSTPSKLSPLANRRLSSNARHPSSQILPIPIATPSTSTPRSISTPPSTSPQTRAPQLTRPVSQPQTAPGTPPPPASLVPGDPYLTQQIAEGESNLLHLSDTIARARNGLVQELVEVFSVVEVGGRPPVGGKAGTKGEWTIGGLVLPVPGDIRRYPPDHINAVLTHTIHFVSLLAFYLGIKLPFEVVWSRSGVSPGSSLGASSEGESSPRGGAYGLLGVGTPWIGAIRGGEGGGWARWSTKHPLHVSASSAPPQPSSLSPSSPTTTLSKVSSKSTSPSSPQQDTDSNPIDLADSMYFPSSSTSPYTGSTSAAGTSFTTALAMLLYDVCYLAYTQAVDIPLAQAGEVLGNLWNVCCSPELGRKSHSTHPHIPYPTPPSFPLDFAQLLQATTSNPSRANARVRGLSGTGSRSRRSSEGGKEVRRKGGERRNREDVIVEEDGWDLV